MTGFFLGVMKLLNLRGVKSRGVFTKDFSSVFLLRIKAFFVKMALRGELKCLKDFAIFALANQVHPDRFPWYYASSKFGQECLLEIILILLPKIQELTTFIKCQIMRGASLGVILVTRCNNF